jgi:tetratricopeptide (TPR) repeat protein
MSLVRWLLIWLVLVVLLLVWVGCAGTGERVRLGEWNRFGVWCAERGYWEEARYWWGRVVEVDPLSAEALNNLAVAAERAHAYGLAEELYQRALSAAPENRRIRANYESFQRLLRAARPYAEGGESAGG